RSTWPPPPPAETPTPASLAPRASCAGQVERPARLPLERLINQVSERHSVHKVLQGPAIGGVRDQPHLLAVPLRRHLDQELARLPDHVLVALTTGPRLVDVPGAPLLQQTHRHPVEHAVMTLTQPPILNQRNPRIPQGNTRGLHGPVQVR